MGKYDAVALAEGPGVQPEKALEFVDGKRNELDMLTHFDGMGIGYLSGGFKRIDPAGYSMPEFKKIYSCWSDVFRKEGWGTIYLGNHDQPRMVTRWGNDSDAYRNISAKMLFSFLLSMRATPFIYNGDEIGMTNIRFEKIEDYKDIETISNYRKIISRGEDGEVFLKDQQLTARDNGRTPFQWNAGPNAGFTNGVPWMRVNENYTFLNAAAQENDRWSVLNHTRKMLRLRKQYPALVYGEYTLLAPADTQVYAYTRSLSGSRLFVLINFSKEKREFIHPFPQIQKKDILINNYPDLRIGARSIRLLPYQAIIVELDR
jgi:oligo-1,6-glucosidase